MLGSWEGERNYRRPREMRDRRRVKKAIQDEYLYLRDRGHSDQKQSLASGGGRPVDARFEGEARQSKQVGQSVSDLGQSVLRRPWTSKLV